MSAPGSPMRAAVRVGDAVIPFALGLAWAYLFAFAPSPWQWVARGALAAGVVVLVALVLARAVLDRRVERSRAAVESVVALAAITEGRVRIEGPHGVMFVPTTTCRDEGGACEPDDGGEPILTGGRAYACLHCGRRWTT